MKDSGSLPFLKSTLLDYFDYYHFIRSANMIIKIDNYTQGNYTIVSNEVTRDNSISLSARGLLIFMLGCKEDTWEFSVAKLIKNTNTSRTKIENALEELENAGYLKRTQTKDNKNKFGKNEWIISEIPNLRDDEPFRS